jgi:hypothetical protein
MWQILKRTQYKGHAYSEMEQTNLFFRTLEKGETKLEELRKDCVSMGFNEPSHEYNEDGDVYKIRWYPSEECYTLIEIICEEDKTKDTLPF